jgi:hypothetical protein
MFSSLEQHCLKEMASIGVTCKWFDRIFPGQLSRTAVDLAIIGEMKLMMKQTMKLYNNNQFQLLNRQFMNAILRLEAFNSINHHIIRVSNSYNTNNLTALITQAANVS